MWRWWIAAGLVVMALGMVGCADEENPCFRKPASPGDDTVWFESPVGESFHGYLASRLDVEIGETAWMTMRVMNTWSHPRIIGTEYGPREVWTVTTPECEPVWTWPPMLPLYRDRAGMYLPPGGSSESSIEWSFVDDWGEIVPPGEYLVHSAMVVDWGPNSEPGTAAGLRKLWLERHGEYADFVKFRRVHITGEVLRAARPEHPPVSVDPSACGGPVDEQYARWVAHEHGHRLQIVRKEVVHGIIGARLLDERRLPTGPFGIRYVVYGSLLGRAPDNSPMMRALPKCLEGVAVQVVVIPDVVKVGEIRSP